MNRIIEPRPVQIEFASYFPTIILASKSENRKALLEKGGCAVIQRATDAKENKKEKKDAETIVLEIAKAKMNTYLNSDLFDPTLPALSADTMVLFNGELIGKAEDIEEARNAIKSFSGNKQDVISASCLYIPYSDVNYFIDIAHVYFKTLSDEEIENYIQTGDWIGAAGSYRLQRNGYSIVERIEGDWTTVVGLPLEKINSYMRSIR